MRRLIATSVVAFLTATTGLVAGAASPAAAAKPRPTPFALGGAGLGTHVKGGDIPAKSGKTAYRVIGCTNSAPLSRTNHLAEATLPGLGDVAGMKTRVWTTARNGVVSSNSRHSLARLVIKSDGLGKVVLKGLTSSTRAWHDNKGFHSSWASDIGAIVYTPATGVAMEQKIPKPGETLVIPGLANIKLGHHSSRSTRKKARASAMALWIEVIPSETTARIAHTRSIIAGGVKSGLFRGNSNATRVQALDGNLSSGPNPFLPMPCQGTDGKVQTNPLAELDLGGQVVVGGANTEQWSDQTNRKAWGYEKSSVAELDLAGGQLVIQGVVGKANVTRRGNKVQRNVRGTTVGSITADGTPHAIPDPGETLEIPGVAKIETRVVNKSKNGIKVTAVRVTLLDGTGAVIDLGQADLRIMRSGR